MTALLGHNDPAAEHNGLSPLGKRVVKRLNELGAELQARKQELKKNPPTKLIRNQQEAFSAAK